jgi:hypothetical protein
VGALVRAVLPELEENVTEFASENRSSEQDDVPPSKGKPGAALARSEQLLSLPRGISLQRFNGDETMPFFQFNGKPGGSLVRKAPFGLPACKLWRKNPSTHDLLAAGAVLLRKDMQSRLNQTYYDAWLNEEDAKGGRKNANGEGQDPRLAKMKEEICDLLEESLRIGDGDRLHAEISSASCLSGHDRSKAGLSAFSDSSPAALGVSGVADIGRK